MGWGGSRGEGMGDTCCVTVYLGKNYCTWKDFFFFCNTKLEGNISRLKLWVGMLLASFQSTNNKSLSLAFGHGPPR